MCGSYSMISSRVLDIYETTLADHEGPIWWMSWLPSVPSAQGTLASLPRGLLEVKSDNNATPTLSGVETWSGPDSRTLPPVLAKRVGGLTIVGSAPQRRPVSTWTSSSVGCSCPVQIGSIEGSL